MIYHYKVSIMCNLAIKISQISSSDSKNLISSGLIDNRRYSIESESGESLDNYYISKRFEVGNIGYRNMPYFLYILLSLDICLYLYVGLSSNTIIASNSIHDILSIMIYQDSKSLSDNYYYIIVGLFIFTILLLSLGNIASLRKFSILIMICRFLVILLILGCCIYSISKNGISTYDEIPKFNMDNITIMLGNSIFFFMIHHSIPGIVESFKPQKKLMSLLFVGFLISVIVMITYGLISLSAFSKFKDCDTKNFPCAIQVISHLYRIILHSTL